MSSRAGARPEPTPPIDDETLHLFCHDFRVPLTTLSAYAELMRAPSLPPEQRRQFAESLLNQAHRLARMVDDLEGLSASSEELAEDALAEAGACVRAAVEDVRLSAEARGVRVVFSPAKMPLPVRVRGDHLQRAVAWLLEVALRRSAANTSVTVWACRDREQVHVGMETGLGTIGESDVEALRTFQPSPAPPDLVRGVAGPLWASLHNLERAGATQVITIVPGGLRWGLLLPPG